MRNHKFFKKTTALALSVAMMLGATSNLYAADIVEETGPGFNEQYEVVHMDHYGFGVCSLYSNLDNGVIRAYTFVNGDDASYYAYSYTDLWVEALDSSGWITIGRDSDSEEVGWGDDDYMMSSSVNLYNYISSVYELYAESNHIIEIDEAYESRSLYSTVQR